MNYLDVALLVPPYKTYTYVIPSYLKSITINPGTVVVVPLKNRDVIGVVLNSHESYPVDRNIEIKEIKFLLNKKQLFLEEHLTAISQLAKHLLVQEGEILSFIIPEPLKTLRCHFQDDIGKKLQLTQLLKDEYLLKEYTRKWLNEEIDLFLPIKKSEIIELIKNPPWPVRKNSKNQIRILEFLYENGPQLKEEIFLQFGSKISHTLKTLKKKGLIKTYYQDKQSYLLNTNKKELPYELTSDQKKVLDNLTPKLKADTYNCSLLYGVTASGKTAVYIELIKKCIELGKSAIFLLPEVALAESALKGVLPYLHNICVYFYHGYLNPWFRANIFRNISQNNEPVVVIGTRSAVFLPVKNPGLIILDEEHDSSYKQDEKLRYHAKNIAYLIARQFNSLLLFGSATPDVNTFFSASIGKIDLYKITTRIKGRELPNIEIIDLNTTPPKFGPFSEKVYTKIKEHLAKGNQVIILINRRGFAPMVFCTSCREVLKCKNCSVSTTYHKKIQRVVCHYCGYSEFFPTPCPVCGSSTYLPLDHGTEQIEEFVSEHFGWDYKVLRLDRDTYKKESKENDPLELFAKGEYKIMVGTQMCSKGHNFPDVTLVVVVNGDIGLNLPDYRAAEKTFQLIMQVAGRSGRGDKKGEVFIQTRNPSHYCWDFLKNNDYEGFFQHEVNLRKIRNYPPFSKLALIRISYPQNFALGDEKIKEIKNTIKKFSSPYCNILGPAPAPIFLMNNKKRYHCLIKGKDWTTVRFISSKILDTYCNISSKIKFYLDLDPYNML